MSQVPEKTGGPPGSRTPNLLIKSKCVGVDAIHWLDCEVQSWSCSQFYPFWSDSYPNQAGSTVGLRAPQPSGAQE